MNYRTLLITAVKKENPYLNEFIEHYRSLNISHILIVDNNDEEDENVYDVIDRNDSFVEVINYRGREFDHKQILTNMYLSYYSNYDFILLFDCDEYLVLNEKYNNDINNYLSEEWFQENDCIVINWVNYDSNKLCYYEDKPLKERFTHIVLQKNNQFKSIINCNRVQDNFQLDITHCLLIDNEHQYKICGNNGCQNHLIINYDNARLNHYIVKSTQEFVERKLSKNNENGYSPNGGIYDYLAFHDYMLTQEQVDYLISLNIVEPDINLKIIK